MAYIAAEFTSGMEKFLLFVTKVGSESIKSVNDQADSTALFFCGFCATHL
jgi:hypothetical protein